MYLEFTKNVINIAKLQRELIVLNGKYESLYSKGDYIRLKFTSNLIQSEVDAVSSLINNFVEIDVTEQINDSLLSEIDPWIDNFFRRVRAENIEMGITQLGKTLPVQALFEKQIELSTGLFVSMMGIMSTGSITLLIPLYDYMIANPSIYSGLDPFITEARLLEWKAEVIEVLS